MLWYETSLGQAYLEQGNYKLALKNFEYVIKHFKTFERDFTRALSYNLQHFNLQNYTQFIKILDEIYKNKYAVKAALGIMKVNRKISQIREEEQKKTQTEYDQLKETQEYKKFMQEAKR